MIVKVLMIAKEPIRMAIGEAVAMDVEMADLGEGPLKAWYVSHSWANNDWENQQGELLKRRLFELNQPNLPPAENNLPPAENNLPPAENNLPERDNMLRRMDVD